MISFIQENYVWLTPILVALVSSIVGGIFQLMKKNASKNKQTIKRVSNSNINQANGNINVNAHRFLYLQFPIPNIHFSDIVT